MRGLDWKIGLDAKGGFYLIGEGRRSKTFWIGRYFNINFFLFPLWDLWLLWQLIVSEFFSGDLCLYVFVIKINSFTFNIIK